MKKVFYSLTCGALLASSVMADFTKVEMGVGAWMQTPKGDITYTESLVNGSDVSAQKEETTPYVWMLVKHPIPIVPNLRVEYVSLANTGTATGQFKDFVALNSKTSLDMRQYDIIPYYNILDNTAWITLDLGVDFKIVELDYRAEDVLVTGTGETSYKETATVVIPMAYLRARMEIPSTDIGLETDIKYITTGDSTVYDVRAKVDYTFDFTPAVQPALEVGYRVQKIKIEDADVSGKIDLEFAGFYAGLMLRF